MKPGNETSLRAVDLAAGVPERGGEELLRLARRIFDSASEAITITDAQNRIVDVNPAFSLITGWPREEVLGKNPSMLSSGQQPPEFYREMWASIVASGSWQGEILNRRKTGEFYPEWLNISAIHDQSGKISHYVAIFSDITERKRVEGLLHRYEFFDSLTDLPNKALLLDRISQAILAARRDGVSFFLVSFNINRLKQVNDSYGHPVGDELLRHAARRLQTATRDGDTVSRVAGDDYVMVVPRIHEAREALALARRLIDVLIEPYELIGTHVHISVNGGIAAFPADGQDADTLIRNADAALNHARTVGPNQVEFYESRMNVDLKERMLLEIDLRQALERKEFSLVFQPQFATADRRLVGFEALLRWQRGEVAVPPSMFIPVAEELDVIVPIGNWVARETCRTIRHFLDLGYDVPPVAINLSAVQFARPGLVDALREALLDTGIPPALLACEVTESVAMHDPAEVLDVLRALRGLGLQLAIDDFGTGYSSLSYLKRFPVDTIKIDRSFVHDMEEDADSRAIISGVIGLARGLGMKALAEGVETERQLQILAELGCDEIQGFLLARPLRVEQMTDFLTR